MLAKMKNKKYYEKNLALSEEDNKMIKTALRNKIKLNWIILPAVILSLFACAGYQLEVEPISKSENPQELINKLDNDIALARNAGATSLGEDYADAEDRFIGLTRAIEDNNLNYAQRNQARVVERFRVLELRAIKVRTIGEVRRLIQSANVDGRSTVCNWPRLISGIPRWSTNRNNFCSLSSR